MNLGRWHQVDKVLEAALEREPGERAAFLDQACAGDEALRQEVEELLKAHEQAGSFLSPPTLEATTQETAKMDAQSLLAWIPTEGSLPNAGGGRTPPIAS